MFENLKNTLSSNRFFQPVIRPGSLSQWSHLFQRINVARFDDPEQLYSALWKAWEAVEPDGTIKVRCSKKPETKWVVRSFAFEIGATLESESERSCTIRVPNPKNPSDAIALALRKKWGELPVSRQGRGFSADLLQLKDDELLEFWTKHRDETSVPEVRGWYQEKYKDLLKGKEVLDFGCGFSVDGLFFSKNGAKVTCADIVRENLSVVERVSKLQGLKTETYYIDDFFNFHFGKAFDTLLCIGSLLHAPLPFVRREMKALLPFLKFDATILVLAYPKSRFDQSKAVNCHQFGQMTDGERTPWADWFDTQKVETIFPGFKVKFERDFGSSGSEFNFFELKRPLREPGL